MLGGCTDTSRMNVDVFRAETAPVFYQYQPVDQTPPVARLCTVEVPILS